ncbi:hypothetical protein Pla110_31260 [Polystyrenella longa]|uniref:DUF1294 domain-containing protein n=1 Tax=Polystyrenella longa TaxID=2528007 RepID=A0A518CQ90_9PLAN|nr:DUF1294 domain-containing protein [Polystyrenella longa]QDU81385.1 hypothetical protein Pla110_31260 [Polystyrenella longa]
MRAAIGIVVTYFLTMIVYGLIYGLNFLWPLSVIGLSIVTYGVFWWDKRKAQNNEWRTPEKTLQTLSVLGGWPGALLAQWHIRHKNRKMSFQAVFWLMVVLNLVISAKLFMPAWSGWLGDVELPSIEEIQKSL